MLHYDFRDYSKVNLSFKKECDYTLLSAGEKFLTFNPNGLFASGVSILQSEQIQFD